MSTHAIIKFSYENAPIAEVYRHFDGMPDVLGDELRAIIEPDRSFGATGHSRFGDMRIEGVQGIAAMIIRELLQAPEFFYLMLPVGRGDAGADYEYHFMQSRETNHEVVLRCTRLHDLEVLWEVNVG